MFTVKTLSLSSEGPNFFVLFTFPVEQPPKDLLGDYDKGESSCGESQVLKVLRLLSITLLRHYWQTVEDLGGLREPEQGQQLTHVGLPRTLTPPVSHMDSPTLPVC
ncbi:hypothetical protein Bbelb_406200 [Branchiostoma belcheri]|nr:hypothetical protein Bbelb_406200 [Branchiostoma belcheri]